MKKIRAFCVVIIALLFSCASFVLAGTSTSTTTSVKDGKKITTKVHTDNKGTTTTTVTVKEKDGAVATTTTVTDKDGRIISTDDPEAQAKADTARQASDERQADLASALKRGPNDPIQVALFQTVMSDDLRKATDKDGVFPYLRKEFDGDSVLDALDQRDVDRYAKDHDFRTGQSTSFSSLARKTEFLPVDVYIESFANLEQKVGINTATKKVGSAPFLVYTARITSEYGGKPVEVKEEGFILANLEVTRKFAAKIKAAVRNEIGPGIPLDAAKFRRATHDTPREEINASEALRNIFKRK